MSSNNKQDQIDALILTYLDDQLAAEQFTKLVDAFHHEPAAVDRFVELASLDRSLQDSLTHGEQIDAMQQANLEHDDPALSFEAALALLGRGSEHAELVHIHDLGSRNALKRLQPYLIGGAIAAMFVLAVTLTFVFNGSNEPSAPIVDQNNAQPSEPGRVGPALSPALKNTVATLTAEHDAKWAEGALAPGSQLRVGQRLTLTQGFAEITTSRGAVAILQAPATIELLNNNAIRLHTGKLVGICETESSKGFVVRTPHMDITDLGTRFGVDATRSNTTEVHVFDGLVKATRPSTEQEPSVSQPIVAGKAIQVSDRSSGFLEVAFDLSGFTALTRRAESDLAPSARAVGITRLSGDVKWSLPSAYLESKPTEWKASEQAIVFEELTRYRLDDDAPVTLLGPGTTTEFGKKLPTHVIPRGTTVRTYIVLLYATSRDKTARPSGSITFQGEVIGIATHEDQARVFTDIVGDQGSLAKIRTGRYYWLDLDTNQNDYAELQDDRRTVAFGFEAKSGTTDAIRVFVRVPEE